MYVAKAQKTLDRLHQRAQKDECFPTQDIFKYGDWLVSSYIFTPGLGSIKLEGFNLPELDVVNPRCKICYLANPISPNEPADICVRPNDLALVKNADHRKPFTSMGTIYVLLPEGLKGYQIKQILQEEFLLSYAATYSVREKWGSGIHELPKIDKKLVPTCNDYSKMWYHLYLLAIDAKELLTPKEAKEIYQGWAWLQKIVHEHRRNKLKSLTQQCLSVADESQPSREPSCNSIAKNLRYTASQLNSNINPYNKQESPYLHDLTEICLSLASQPKVYNKFIKERWKPYIRSIRAWARRIENDPRIKAVKPSKDGEKAVKQHRTNRSKDSY